MIRKIFLSMVGSLAGIALAGCSDVNDKNRLSVYVCDAPATEFEQVTLQISQVELRETGSTDTWKILPLKDGELELLTLVNGTMKEIAVSTIEGGKSFDAARLTFDPGTAVITLGGEKIQANFDAQDIVVIIEIDPIRMDGPNQPLLFDIDAAQSVSEIAGVENGYRIKPVIRFVNPSKTGAVQGGLQIGESLLAKQALIRFTHNETGAVFSTYNTTSSSVQGAFFMRLLPGEYLMEIQAPTDMDLKTKSELITIIGQQLLDLGVIELETNTTTEE